MFVDTETWSVTTEITVYTDDIFYADGFLSGPSLGNVEPPMCLRVFDADTNYEVEQFLSTLPTIPA